MIAYKFFIIMQAHAKITFQIRSIN